MPSKKPQKKKNAFLDYEQRDYDFAEIERKIAEKNKEDYLKWHAEEAKNSR